MKKRLEHEFRDELLIALCQLPATRAWTQNAGKLRDARGNWIKLMPPGAADIGGVMMTRGLGLAFQIETKVAGRKQTAQQVAWERMCEMVGAVYLLAPFDDALDMAENVRIVVARLLEARRITAWRDM